MPDLVTHYYFGQQVLTRLPEPIIRCVDISIYDRALQGPDTWSVLGFYGGRNKQYAKRSGILHKSGTGDFLCEMVQAAKKYPDTPMFSVLAGAICHYCLDKRAHPYIICKGGCYDGTPETAAYKSGHLRLERAIDSYVIRHIYGAVPWKLPMAKRFLRLRQYPECLRAPLDAVYRQVYGWENVFDLLNRSLRDERLFYKLVQDPFGLVQKLLRPVSGGRTDYSMFSYYHREADPEQVDFLNTRHGAWTHPFAPGSVSNSSFFELFDQALQEAVEMIRAAHGAIYRAEEPPLADIFGDDNYSTGLPCDDPRNLSAPRCEPLDYCGA